MKWSVRSLFVEFLSKYNELQNQNNRVHKFTNTELNDPKPGAVSFLSFDPIINAQCHEGNADNEVSDTEGHSSTRELS